MPFETDNLPTPKQQPLVDSLSDEETKAIRDAAGPSGVPGWNETGYGKLNQVYTWGHEKSPWNALHAGESLEGYPINENRRSFFGKIDGKDSPLTQITMRLADRDILQYPNREIPRTEGSDALNSDTVDICVTMPGTALPSIDIRNKISLHQLANGIEIEEIDERQMPGAWPSRDPRRAGPFPSGRSPQSQVKPPSR